MFYYIISIILLLAFFIKIISLITLNNKYSIACDSMKDDLIICGINEKKNIINDPNFLQKKEIKRCQKIIDDKKYNSKYL